MEVITPAQRIYETYTRGDGHNVTKDMYDEQQKKVSDGTAMFAETPEQNPEPNDVTEEEHDSD